MTNREFLADAREIVGRPLDQIGRGLTFIASWKSPEGGEIADNGIWGLVLYNTSQRIHLTFEVAGGGANDVQVYELASLSATGTPVTPYNLKRGSGIGPTVNVWHSPTAPTGTLLANWLQPDGVPSVMGGVGRLGTEWELSTGTPYFVGGVNRAGSSQPASVVAQWYEDSYP